MSNNSAFVKPPEPDEDARMNVRKWLRKGHARIVKRVEVYLAAGLQPDIEELDAQIQQARNAAPANDERLSSVGPDLADMAARVEALRADMEASKTVFRFQAIDAAKVEEIVADTPKGKGDEPEPRALTFALLEYQCVEPKGMTREDFEELLNGLGEGYFNRTLLATAIAARDGANVSVPFSFVASEILRTRASSAN